MTTLERLPTVSLVERAAEGLIEAARLAREDIQGLRYDCDTIGLDNLRREIEEEYDEDVNYTLIQLMEERS